MDREKVIGALNGVVVPLLLADGGRAFLVKLDESEIHVHLAGRFSGCPGNTLVERRILEPALRALAPELMVKITSGAQVPDDALPLAITPSGA